MPAEKERARNWEERKQQATGHKAAPHTAVRRTPTGHTTRHKGTMRCEHCSNHQMRRTPSEPSTNTPPLPLQGAHVLHKGGGCAPRAGRCPPRGWQQGRDQPTAHGTVHVVRRCEIPVPGGRRVGQEGVRDMGTQERQQTGGGVTQTHRTREPHQEGQGRAQQTRRRGTARQERQPEQREQRTRMEQMAERAHGREAATIKEMAWPASPVATGCQGNPCSTGIRWGVSPAAQMGCLRNRSGSPSGADQP